MRPLINAAVMLICCALMIAGVFPIASAAGPVLTGAVKQGGAVSATPISIPRPIQLEKFVDFVPINNKTLSSTGEGFRRIARQ